MRYNFQNHIRQKLFLTVSKSLFGTGSKLMHLNPAWSPRLNGLRRVQNIAYLSDGLREHLLDIYFPQEEKESYPVVFYVHGGGFRLFTKETHWLMAQQFASQGYLVVNISYRLAPGHPFPAALEDTAAAYLWLVKNIGFYGGDLERIIWAGESAGANLILALFVAMATEREELWAQALQDCGVLPKALLPACGLFEVSFPDRFERFEELSRWLKYYIRDISEAYLPVQHPYTDAELQLANPLQLFENKASFSKPLPKMFLPVGTSDPVLNDTQRLEKALRNYEGDFLVRYYGGQPHVFHGMLWKDSAKQCWKDTFTFLAESDLAPSR